MAGEAAARIGVHLHRHVLSDADLCQILLRQIEIDKHRIERLERDDGGAGGDVLAQIDLSHAELPGEGRADGFLVDHRLLRRHLGTGGLERAEIAVHHRLRHALHL